MENSTWQSKCGPSMWQSSLPSSSQLHSQRPDNEELTSSNHRMVQEAILLRNSNLDFGKSGCSELGSSFLSLLSRPPSLLQCDLQLSPSLKSIIASSNTPINSSKASDFASGIEVSIPSSGLLTPNPDRQNAEAGADFSSNFSSIPVSAKCLTGSGLNNVFPVPGLNFQKSELMLPIINQKGPSTERSKELFLLREGSISNNFTGNIGNVHNGTNVSSVSRQSSALSSGCLRVFCLGISGYLLLSSAGLLGVVCSCHGMHMSVSNFSKHSGLCNANPGVAVFMGSGETIAQWRKDHFGKLGISIPGDYSGWDWSDGISVTAGKLGPTLPDISICSDVSPQVSSFGASQFSGQYRNNVAFPEHPKVGCHVVDKFLHEEKQLQGHNFLFKGLNSTTLSNYDSVTDKKVMSRVMTGGSTMSSSVSVRGTDNVSQSTSGYKDKNSKFWNSSVSFPQNQKCPGKSFNARKVEGPIVYRDSVSSNFELRLGQPSVQSRALESSSLLASGSNQIGAPWEAKSSVLADQLPKLDSCRDGISQSILKREQSRFYQNHLPGCYSSTYASQVDRYEGDIAGVSANPLLLPHGKYHEENVHLKGTNDVMNGNHAMAGKHLCESYIAKGDSFGFPWVSGCRMDRESNSNALYGENKNGEGVGCALDSSCIAAEQNISYSTKFKESSFPNQFMWGSGHNRSYLEDSGLNTRQFSSMKVNASDIECLGKISCPEHHGWSGHEFPKTISSSIDSGITLASQALVVASSRTNSNSIHSPTLACSNKGSICARQCSVPDSLQMFASQQQHTPEFPNRNHSSASIETIRDQYMFRKSYDKTQVSIASSTSKGQYCGYHFASTPCASGVASEFHTSRLAYWMGADKEKLTPVAGSTKHRHFSGLSQGKSLPTGGAKMQCQLSHVMYPTERPLLRFSGSKDQITLPSLPGKSFQAEPYTNFPTKCSCATKTTGVDKNYFKDGALATALKELGGNAAGGAATLYVSNVNEMYNYPNESSFQNRDLLGQRMKKVECTSFQWRDVPRKMEEMCGRMTKEQQTGSVSKNGDDEGRTPNAVAAYANCFKTSTQDAELLKEQEMSNISSGCSAPVVTQISIGNDNKDSPTVDAVDRSCRNNLVVDEGSGIERCCSSDDALDSELSAGFCGFPSVINSMDVRSTERTPSETSRSLIDELRLRDLLRLKKMQNQCPSFTIQEKSNHTQIFEICSRKRKKRRMMKWKRLNASFPPSSQSIAQKGSLKCIGSNELHSYAFKDMGMLLRNDQESSNNCACSSEPSSKRRKSALSPSVISLETNFHRINHHGGVYVDNQTKKTINHDNFEAPEVIRRKRLRLASANPTSNEVHINESSSVGAEVTGTSSGNEVNIHKSIARPIVCGKYGIISNGSPSKRAKIVCMKKILIATKKSCLSENAKTNFSSVKKFKKSSSTKSRGFFIEPSSLEKDVHSRGRDGVANRAESSHVLLSELNPQCSLGETEIACSNSSKECESLSRVIKKRSHDKFDEQHSAWNSCPTQLKPKSKEIRERSLYELTATGKDSSSLNFSTVKKSTPVWQRKRRYNGKLVKNAADVIHNAKKCMKEDHYKSALDSGSLCCVCGSSNKEESNYLLKCNSCSIKVHQACYGILKVPKAHWYCRPCKTSSKDIACVLCGYGGGAMTCALQSHNIVKSLLQAWDIDYETKDTDPVSSKPSRNQLNLLASSNSRAEDDTFSVIKVADSQSSLLLLGNMDLHLEDGDSLSFAHDSVVRNSITAGALDPTVKQWVHVVCGLWTPGTCCPNVDTMSAFDVSGAIWTKSDVVCSICTRPGGACIECRVADCSVHFHPWCAQQKGLLQSEVEGGHKENVGFYGRCMDHATLSQSNAGDYPTEGEKEFTCARTEGYKGRKWDDSKSILPHCPDRSNGCHVPQEQLNAWLHINGQRSFPVVLSKFWKSEIEFDYRKEYARYKQSKGWKHLVVYKSGIHGLGLYTSQFISRGAMVVEYVGEIVGLRVTDKRESEYQTGKKLQYKSACYFFRIDKEHIIDATRKGGIARFVNHSCLPNCVAKVISVRNEKKVVFFAERDIYPGEEITYDYHFNHEDEGKKIPCFCNSKNCRRYLN